MEKNILVKKKLLVSNKVGRMTVNKIFFKSSLTNYGLHHSVFLVIYDIFEKTSEELNRTPKLTIPTTLVCRSLCERYCTFNLGRGPNEAFHPYWAFHLPEAGKYNKQLSLTMTFPEINSHHGFNTTLNHSSPDSHKLFTQRRAGSTRLRYVPTDIIDSFQLKNTFPIETSHLICSENQMFGFCVKLNTDLKWVKDPSRLFSIFCCITRKI